MNPAPRTARDPRRALPHRLVEWVAGVEQATYSMSALRILIGTAILWSLVTSAADRRYLWGAGSAWVDPAVDRRGYPEFLRAVFPKDDPLMFDLSYGILVTLAILFILGFATRLVTPLLLFYWLALSTNSVFLTNGGDVVIRLVLLFCIVANLSAHWSIDSSIRQHRGSASIYPVAVTSRIPEWARVAAHNTAVLLCSYQVLLIYVNSAIFKLMGDEWLQGSALYYALQLDVFQVFPELSSAAWQSTPLVMVGSWVSLWVQLLFPVLLLWRPTRDAALIVIMVMHLGIGLFLGLWPFSIAMIALDLVFVRDMSWKRFFAWCASAREGRRLPSFSRPRLSSEG